MTHPRDLISGHLDGELGADEARLVTSHLSACRSCRDEMEAVATARALVRGLPELRAPDAAVGAATRGRGRARRRLAGLAAAAAATTVAVALVIGPGEADSTFDLDALIEQHTARVVVDPGISTLRGPVGGG